MKGAAMRLYYLVGAATPLDLKATTVMKEDVPPKWPTQPPIQAGGGHDRVRGDAMESPPGKVGRYQQGVGNWNEDLPLADQYRVWPAVSTVQHTSQYND